MSLLKLSFTTTATNLYFASDFHLGVPTMEASLEREKKIVAWLESIAPTAGHVFLMGDVFDFWYEYKKVVPKGFVRLQGAIARLTDAGVQVHFFKGNHDMWVNDYFTTELGITIHADEFEFEHQGKKFYLHHGDGLGPGDKAYKFLKKIFRNPFCEGLFGLLPPRIGLGIAHAWSMKSRLSQNEKEYFRGNELEHLYQYCTEMLEKTHYDYFIFGHRHLVLDIALPQESRYINLGEWVTGAQYAVFENGEMSLNKL